MVLGSALHKLKAKTFPPCNPISTEKPSTSANVHYLTDKKIASEAMDHLVAMPNLLGLDIETYPTPQFVDDKDGGLVPRKSAIRLIQIYDGIGQIYVFDVKKMGGTEGVCLESLWNKPMVAHNALFELKHLLHAGIRPLRLGCTLLADRVLNGSRSKLRKDLGLRSSAGLKDLAKELLGEEISKEMQKSDWSQEDLSENQISYAALDAVLPTRIFSRQRDQLKALGLCRTYEILRDAQYAVAQMELNGIGFDLAEHNARLKDWQRESNKLQKEICDCLGRNLNLNSGKQIGEWLHECLKQEDLEAWIKTDKGHLSTSTPTFKMKEQAHALFPKIIEYRHVTKKISSFGENLYTFIDSTQNRLYSSFSLGTTSTGRMASQNPNLQNIPRSGFRDLFVAREGYALIGLDYSQQELRVAALVTSDKELLRVYAEGGDIHTNTAAAILNVPKDSVTKAQRQLAKAVIFGLLYGQGAKGLAVYAKQQYGLEMTEEEAEKHRSALFQTYSGLRRWQMQTGKVVQVTGKIRTQCGRLRDFNREQEGYRFTAALNLPIQGAAAEITLRAITRIASLLSHECFLVNVIHDEILLEVEKNKIQEVSEEVKNAMEQAFLDVFPSAGPYLKGVVEARIGNNWAETK